MAIIAFQMRVGSFRRWAYATNPYTGRALCHDILKPTPFGKTFKKVDEEEEIEEEIDECAPMSKGEYDDWCNGIGFGR